jgi:hypothetical protein
MNIDKQFLIHVATEILIITTVTVFINKRISKVEKALLDQQYKTRELEYKIQHLEGLLSSVYQRQPPIPRVSPDKKHQPIAPQVEKQQQQQPKPQGMFDIPIGLQYLFGVPPERTHRHQAESPKTSAVNVEIIQEEEKKVATSTTVEDDEEDEKIVEEALHSILSDDQE